MATSGEALVESITLSQAKELIKCLAHDQSILMLSAPGVGKSEAVAQVAEEVELPCRSLLGTQIAPEDVSGIPRIVGERSVFCPPRVLLPEKAKPFCLFLDELPACTPDIQKAFYSLLLDRRIGEFPLPEGSWVVAAGNRAQDRALVRTISSALVNRVILLHVRVDADEWIAWARNNGVRADVIDFIQDSPGSLARDVPKQPVPFSTPRAWTLFSEALELAEAQGILDDDMCLALAAGRISEEDVQPFFNWWKVNRQATEDVSKVGLSALLSLSVWDLDLPQRVVTGLEQQGLATIADLVVRREDELVRECTDLDQYHIGDIKKKLAEKGLWLGMVLDPHRILSGED